MKFIENMAQVVLRFLIEVLMNGVALHATWNWHLVGWLGLEEMSFPVAITVMTSACLIRQFKAVPDVRLWMDNQTADDLAWYITRVTSRCSLIVGIGWLMTF